MSPRHVQIDQSAGHEQPVGVLVQTAVTDLVEAEDALEDEKRVFDLGADSRLGTVLRTLGVRQGLVAVAFLVRKILCSRGMLSDHPALPGVGRVAPDTSFLAMEQVGQQLAVMYIGCRGGYRMDQLAPTVHADVRLHPEVPLVALPGLMHLRVPFPILVLGEARRTDDGGVHNGAGGDLQPVLLKILGNQRKQPVAEVVALQQVAELADGGLVRRRLPAQVDADEPAHRPGIVQRLFHRRVRKAEPVLQKMDAQHALNTHRRTASAIALWIKRLDHRRQLRPGYDPVHLLEKLFPAGRLAVLLETFFGKGMLAHRVAPV